MQQVSQFRDWSGMRTKYLKPVKWWSGNDETQEYRPIVACLSHSRYLAGWCDDSGAELRGVWTDTEVFGSEDEAAYRATNEANRAAENEADDLARWSDSFEAGYATGLRGDEPDASNWDEYFGERYHEGFEQGRETLLSRAAKVRGAK